MTKIDNNYPSLIVYLASFENNEIDFVSITRYNIYR